MQKVDLEASFIKCNENCGLPDLFTDYQIRHLGDLVIRPDYQKFCLRSTPDLCAKLIKMAAIRHSQFGIVSNIWISKQAMPSNKPCHQTSHAIKQAMPSNKPCHQTSHVNGVSPCLVTITQHYSICDPAAVNDVC